VLFLELIVWRGFQFSILFLDLIFIWILVSLTDEALLAETLETKSQASLENRVRV